MTDAAKPHEGCGCHPHGAVSRRAVLAGGAAAAGLLAAGGPALAQDTGGAARPGRQVRAARMTKVREDLVVGDVTVPAPGPAEAVIRVEASGICRSDWHWWNGDLTWFAGEAPVPVVLGHEVGGVVEEVGRDVRAVKPGDRVTVPFHEACGTCPECVGGRHNRCERMQNPGTHHDGGWARYMRVPTADLNCIRLPDEVDFLSAAALGCRFMTAYHGVTARGRVRPGEWVAVHGCGGVGLSAVQIAAATEALVVAVDVDEAKLKKAREEGAVAVVNARAVKDVPAAVRDLTKGGAHVSVDALGRAETARNSIRSLRRGGRHVQIGLTTQAERGEVAIPLDLLTVNEWEVVGSLGNPHPDYPALLALVARGKLNPKRLVTREVGLGDVTAVLKDMTEYKTVGFNVITRFA